ncbi:dynein axonemal light chain 1-like [Polistes fuscatus]|uniref:dynein axonemal light chain 1-like n=1 Tax=Polistes fuscatus TaxID=30207 RepID=UPI001CA86E15|nr:dynein axonemal light chain 1-like [Polistes fuscatus]XP_043501263.1 dynein axonemal light chain 1-like [Polistes fuscatus]XP_043501264.1 dynein axonemal light chain 1-like [Polistes fuscatus]
MDPALKHLKPTTCKEAIQKWEEKTGLNASEAKEVIISFQWPPIEKMDNSLAVFVNVEKLSLSSNTIERISGINSLKNLRILSVARNSIKSFSGLEGVGDHLEELWISYNMIEKTRGVNLLKALKVLYIGNNLIRDWVEFNRLQEIPNLEDLLFINNPLWESMDIEAWRTQAIKRLPKLKKLDSIPIVRATDDDDDL